MTDPQAIAARLSEAQKAMLGRARRCGLNEPRRCYGPGVTMKALRERGLAHGDFCYLTPLGEAVRSILGESNEQN